MGRSAQRGVGAVVSDTVRVDAIRAALDGVVPAMIATVSAEGVPNIAYLSQVEYIDPQHVALSFQFFNTTRANVLATRQAQVTVIDPHTVSVWRLRLAYLRTEDSGPLFERMRAKLAGIASYTGMEGVFVLRGADVYRVESLDAVKGRHLPAPPPRCPTLTVLRAISQRLSACATLEQLIDETMACLKDTLGVPNAVLLLDDPRSRRLYTVASHGYAHSGVGSEIALGEGLIGVAAREAVPIRIGHATSAYRYAQAMRDSVARQGPADPLQAEIPLPALGLARSQMAVPLIGLGRVQGVLFLESAQDLYFGYDDEDLFAAIGAQLGPAIALLQAGAAAAESHRDEAAAQPGPPTAPAEASGPPLTVRHFAPNDSVFLDDDYLIKGVAGAIFWKLVNCHVREKRSSFSNRELRLDPSLGLPELSDNLEARLILLQRRLAERGAGVAIEKTGRGRFRLCVRRPLALVELPSG